MVHRIPAAIAQTLRGIAAAVRAQAKIAWLVAAAVFVFNLVTPVAVLSVARKPPDYATFNPWFPSLPEFLRSEEPLAKKLSFLATMAIGWVSADGPDGVDWALIVDVPTLARTLLISLLFGAYFALWSYRRRQGEACGLRFSAARPAGVAGALTSVLGISTGPCSLAGCGAPVLPVVGLAFTGLSSGTISLFNTLSRVGIALVLLVMSLAVVWFGWRAGTARIQGALRPT